jgi:hypothetical protein
VTLRTALAVVVCPCDVGVGGETGPLSSTGNHGGLLEETMVENTRRPGAVGVFCTSKNRVVKITRSSSMRVL